MKSVLHRVVKKKGGKIEFRGIRAPSQFFALPHFHRLNIGKLKLSLNVYQQSEFSSQDFHSKLSHLSESSQAIEIDRKMKDAVFKRT